MAVFLLNVCKFSGCGLTYPSLGDLIHHIEETHIECEPTSEEPCQAKSPSSIPMSSALRFYSHLPTKRPALSPSSPLKTPQSPRTPSSQLCSPGGDSVPPVSHRRANSVGSTSPSVTSEETDEHPAVDSEDSNDSWTTQEEFSADFIMRYGSKPDTSCMGDEKPYACPVPGCTKRYKNVNGIKYHAKNGHKKDSKIKKMFKCHCGKSYKTNPALRSHAMCSHPGVSLTTITTASGEVLLIPSSQVTTLQPVRVSFSALVNGHIGSVPLRSLTSGQLLTASFKDCLRRAGDRGSTLLHASPSSGLLVRSDDTLVRRTVAASSTLSSGKPISVQLGVPVSSSSVGVSAVSPLSTRVIAHPGGARTASFKLQHVSSSDPSQRGTPGLGARLAPPVVKRGVLSPSLLHKPPAPIPTVDSVTDSVSSSSDPVVTPFTGVIDSEPVTSCDLADLTLPKLASSPPPVDVGGDPEDMDAALVSTHDVVFADCSQELAELDLLRDSDMTEALTAL